MIKLTKLNNDEFYINCNQIESIEIIPESKVILMNKDFYIVKESAEEILEKIIEYNAKVHNFYRSITLTDYSDEVDF